MTTLVFIADTHNQHNDVELPDGDILIHAGDFCYKGDWPELYAFANWLKEIRDRFKHVVMTPGNHDFPCEKGPQAEIEDLLDSGNCHYLVDKEVELDGIRFYGAPWVPNLRRWAFYGDDDKLKSKWVQIPNNIDILVTHGPPHKILDDVARCGGENWPGWEEHVGCEHLLKHSLRVKPKIHVFGHIHECGGQIKEFMGTKYVNASVLDENYQMTNEPIVLETKWGVK